MVFEMDVALNPRVVPISCLSLMLTITFYINLWMDNNSVKIVIEFTEKNAFIPRGYFDDFIDDRPMLPIGL
jgi:hypothetical protein